MSDPANPNVLEPGDIIAEGYVVERFLAGGGMGQVYVARDAVLDRQVAVKLLHLSFATEAEADERFRKEALALSRVVHPNVVGIHAFGRHQGALYLVMEYIEGESLEDLLGRVGTLSPEEAVTITRQIASGLEEAHELGIIHRDIKPGNILIRRLAAGAVLAKVVDFGLARETEGDSDTTGDNNIMGTPAYMSPEQVQGRELDGRSDLYSLGVMLFQMLTGRSPFQRGSLQATLIAHLMEEAPALGEPPEGVDAWPPGFEDVLAKSMRINRDARQKRVSAFADELGQCVRPAGGGDGPPRDVVECPSCDYPDAKPGGYCANCGAAVPLTSCPACGTDREGERYTCVACGTSLLAASGKGPVGGGAAGYEDPDAGDDGLGTSTAVTVLARIHAQHAALETHISLPGLMTAAVEREGGRVLGYFGSEALAVFGLGGMRERDPEAAVDAGLALNAAFERLEAARREDAKLSVAIDLGTVAARGVGVIYGSAYAGGPAVERSRIAAIRSKKGVVLTGAAYREVEALYEAEDAGSGGLKRIKKRREIGDALARFANLGDQASLVGRDVPMEEIQLLAEKARRDSQMRVVTVSGPAGAGRSRMLAELWRWMENHDKEWFLDIGRCSATDGVPYDPFGAMLRARIRARELTDSAELVRRLRLLPGLKRIPEGPAGEARIATMVRLLGLDSAAGSSSAEVQLANPAEQEAAFETFALYLRGAATEKPLVLVIDDLDKAGQPTLKLLKHVLRSCADVPLIAVLAIDKQRAAQVIEGIDAPRGTLDEIDIGPFKLGETRTWLADRLPGLDLPESAIKKLHDYAGGLPGRLSEAVDVLIEVEALMEVGGEWQLESRDSLNEALGRSLRDLVARRVGRLAPVERELVTGVAVAGGASPRGLLRAVLEGELSEATIEKLKRTGMLGERQSDAFAGEREFSLRHSAHADLLVEALPQNRLATLHQRAARWLEAWRGPRPPGFGAMLARHYMVAGDGANAASYLLSTARDAIRAYANKEAFDAYGVAVELLRDAAAERTEDEGVKKEIASALLGRAETGFAIGEAEAAERAAQQAVEMGEAGDLSPSNHARALMAKAEVSRLKGHYDSAAEDLEKAAAIVADDEKYRSRWTMARSQLAMTRMRQGMDGEAEQVARETLAGLEGVKDDDPALNRALGRVHSALGHVLSRRGELDEAIAEYDAADRCFEIAKDVIGAAMAAFSKGNAAYRGEELDRAEAIYREAVERFGELGYRYGEAIARTNLGNVLLDNHKIDPALKVLREAEKMMRAMNADDLLPETLRLIARCLLERGETAGASTIAHEAVQRSERTGNHALKQAATVILTKVEQLNETAAEIDAGELSDATMVVDKDEIAAAAQDAGATVVINQAKADREGDGGATVVVNPPPAGDEGATVIVHSGGGTGSGGGGSRGGHETTQENDAGQGDSDDVATVIIHDGSGGGGAPKTQRRSDPNEQIQARRMAAARKAREEDERRREEKARQQRESGNRPRPLPKKASFLKNKPTIKKHRGRNTVVVQEHEANAQGAGDSTMAFSADDMAAVAAAAAGGPASKGGGTMVVIDEDAAADQPTGRRKKEPRPAAQSAEEPDFDIMEDTPPEGTDAPGL